MNGLLDSAPSLSADADLVRGIALLVFALVTFIALSRVGRADDDRVTRSPSPSRRMPAWMPRRASGHPTPAVAASETPAPVTGSATAGSLVGTR